MERHGTERGDERNGKGGRQWRGWKRDGQIERTGKRNKRNTRATRQGLTIPQSPNVIPARIPFSPSPSFSSLLPSFPLLSLSLFLSIYLDIRERPRPMHFVRPPAKENIPRLSSQLLLSRIFHRCATRENGRDRGEKELSFWSSRWCAESPVVIPRRGCQMRLQSSISCLQTFRNFDWPINIFSWHPLLNFLCLIKIFNVKWWIIYNC